LTGGAASVEGAFAWTDGSITVNATGEFEVTFTPNDENNYEIVKFNVSVTATSTSSGGGTTYYTVTFDTDGGSRVNSQSVARNGRATKPADPTKEGYTFAGWYADKALTTEYNFNNSITGNITIYAKWTEKTGTGTLDTKKPTPDPNEWENPFEDVKKGDWFYNDVGYVYVNGLMACTSTSPMLFSPNASMTRAMLVTVLWRMAGSPATSGTPFTDVSGGLWYSEAVAWAAENGIVLGIGGGLFVPDAEITRQDMAVMLLRYLNYIKADYVVTDDYRIFADEVDIADYAKDAVQVLNKLGIILGKGNNIIDPKGTATRAEVAAMLHRIMELVK